MGLYTSVFLHKARNQSGSERCEVACGISASNRYPTEAKAPSSFCSPDNQKVGFLGGKKCLTLSVPEMPNRSKDKESGVFVDIWLIEKPL